MGTSIERIRLAEPAGSDSVPFDLLIRADTYSKIILPGVKKGPLNARIAQQTIFGGIISGPAYEGEKKEPCTLQVNHLKYDDLMQNELKKFWELKEVPRMSLLTTEEKECERHFLTHRRLPNGQYEVRLPLKRDPFSYLEDTEIIAKKIFKSNESRLRNSSQLKEYNEFLAEYRALGHMIKTTCAPFIANRVLRQLAEDEKEKFPIASAVLQEDFYVDDAMFGTDDIPLLK
ncbi:PREDICTED: uncharacterized protein LOC105457314 [Wasmannia auropunctata]|uniref:uncharacterized protein LOC105457314 n=1 Tax=Wasmannia auropunctata TaxID=64793 RepID=UPI0005ED6CA9|nr:PREDICTED: uncharacterized protein LOC105457314 [Wasmannia auropunctata]